MSQVIVLPKALRKSSTKDLAFGVANIDGTGLPDVLCDHSIALAEWTVRTYPSPSAVDSVCLVGASDPVRLPSPPFISVFIWVPTNEPLVGNIPTSF